MNATGTLVMAIADGLLDGGVRVATNYPGFHSNELSDALPCPVTSVSERTALAIAWGACVGGWRSVMTCKNVGLMDAADVFLGCHRCGVNAGLVVVVFDDIDGEHSQCLFDARNLVRAVDGFWFEPSGVADAYLIARAAPAVSERLDLPVVIRVANRLYQRLGTWRRDPPDETPCATFRADPERWVVHPSTVASQEARNAQRRARINRWLNDRYRHWNPPTRAELLLASGPSLAGETTADLVLDALPLAPDVARKLSRWSKSGGRIRVREAGDPVIASMVSQSLANSRVSRQPAPMRRPNRKWHNRTDWEPLYRILRRANSIVVGDLGSHLMDPRRTVDVCLCYGAATAVAIGLAGPVSGRPVVAVTGDGAFAHAGWGPVVEAMLRKHRILVVLLDNNGCRGTGGQRVAQVAVDQKLVPCLTMQWRDVAATFGGFLDQFTSRSGPQVIRILNAPA